MAAEDQYRNCILKLLR